jgi:glutamine cyclotransferase
MRRDRERAAVCGLLLAVVIGLAPQMVRAEAGAATPAVAPRLLRVEVRETLPHDPTAFTQGLVWHSGRLLESTGLSGRSSLREVEPKTGKVRRRVDLERRYFGEGLARVGDRLFQLTWQDGVAFVYDHFTFTETARFAYEGEGWGLCYDGSDLVMSDGSSTLVFRDPATFEVRRSVTVRLRGQPLARVNELECVGGSVYANVWMTDEIVVIDAKDGTVTAVIDASGLLSPVERARADVLNGIAHDPKSGDFYITGKLWPKLFRVRFVPR